MSEMGNEKEIDVTGFKDREIIIHHHNSNIYGKDGNSIPSKRIVKCVCCNEKKYCWKRHITCSNSEKENYYCLDCTVHNDDYIIYPVTDSKTHATLIDKDQPLNSYMKGFKKIIEEKPISESQWVRARDYQ